MTCFNRKDKTVRAINQLISGNPNIQFEFIVVDDASIDGTAVALSYIPEVVVLHGNGSLFYSGGMRLAIQVALEKERQYDYVMLFNDDVDFFSNSIEKLTSLEEGGIWVGPTCDNQKKISYGGIIMTSRFRPSFDIIKADTPKGKSCDTFNANCVLIPWNIFKTLGNMDVVYSHSLGDFDYGLEAKRQGFEIRVASEYVGICCDNPSKGSWRDVTLSRKRRLQLKESPKGLPRKEWFHYLRKNYNVITAIIYSIIPYLRILLKK
jgi:GT2 family glycosyltransferase